MSSNRGYKIRSYTSGHSKDGSEYKNFALTVPNDIAERVPNGMTFVPRMTNEGLLYEPVDQAQPHLPAWARTGKNGKKSERAAASE
jgi:hypothetical protein